MARFFIEVITDDGADEPPTGAEVALAIETETQGADWVVSSATPKKRVPSGYITMDECRHLAATYDGGEGQPSARTASGFDGVGGPSMDDKETMAREKLLRAAYNIIGKASWSAPRPVLIANARQAPLYDPPINILSDASLSAWERHGDYSG